MREHVGSHELDKRAAHRRHRCNGRDRRRAHSNVTLSFE